MSRYHPVDVDNEVAHLNLSCSHCGSLSVSVKSFLAHLRTHVRNHETVTCPFRGCLFMSNVVGTFTSHFSKNHRTLDVNSLKDEVKVTQYADQGEVSSVEDHMEVSENGGVDNTVSNKDNDPCPGVSDEINTSDVESEVALFFLKLKTVHGIPNTTVNDIVSEIVRLTDISKSSIQSKVQSVLDEHNVAHDIAGVLTEHATGEFPFKKLTEKNCMLSTEWRREKYIQSKFTVINPREVKLGMLNGKECTYAYVPFIDVLRNILGNPVVLKAVLTNIKTPEGLYMSYNSGLLHNENKLFNSENFSIQIANTNIHTFK